jgi:serine/threonine protein kinase
VLVDFGLAKEYIEDNTTTIIRHGSPGYAAPEQYGSGTNPRTDIYGLGATLYTLLTGIVPLDAIARVTGRKGIDPLAPVHLVNPSIRWADAMAIEQAMSISSDDRFNTVEEFWQELTSHASKQQVDKPRFKSLAPDQHRAVPAHQRKQLKTSPPALHHQAQPPKSRKRAFFFTALVAILAITIGMVLVSLVLKHNNTSSTSQGAAPTLVHSTSLSTTTPVTTPQSNVKTGVPAYPDISPSYAGTVLDLLNNEKTSLFLTHIHQNSGNITGYFQGLGLAGPFTGTVTHTGHLQFKVDVPGGSSFLSFGGDIKIGGDLTGTFEAFNQQSQFTGESGPWNASANQ